MSDPKQQDRRPLARHLPSVSEQVLAMSEDHLAGAMAAMSEQINRIASDLSRIDLGTRTSGRSAASDAVHTVMWGMANINLDRVVRLGAEVDLAREKVAAEHRAAQSTKEQS